MRLEIVMPKLGESIVEGTILQWKKQVGDKVEAEDTLLEVSTDKVDSEVPSPADGTLAEILYPEGETVDVGTVIAYLETDANVEAKPAEETPKPEAAPQTISTAPSGKEGTKEEKPAGDRFYSPLVLSIARKEKIPMDVLEQIPGTGSNGRLTKKDLLQAVKFGLPQPNAANPESFSASPRVVSVAGHGSRQEMDNVRKRTAEHMRRSLDTSAHAYSLFEVDVTDLVRLIDRSKGAFSEREGFKLTLNHFVLHAVTQALVKYPWVNARIEGTEIVTQPRVGLGMAVASAHGLMVPVIRDADERSFRGLSREATRLAIAARDKKLVPDEVFGATFSVTNYGVFGQDMGFPIINQPNVAILGVGAVKKKPAVIETEAGDAIVVRQFAWLTLGFDHRLIDGDLAAHFLQEVAGSLTRPSVQL
mgnify:CR=1 FL=1